MIPCITIGDSIAVGVGQARPECEIVAKVGITSGRYVSTLLPAHTTAGTAVISLGVNDGDTANTLDNLRQVRSTVQAGSVVWLLPGLKPDVRDMIRTVAEENGDRTIDTLPQVGRDHLHPTRSGYERIAASALGAGPADSGVEVADAPEERRASRARPAEPRYAESRPAEPSPAEPRPAEPRPAEPRPVESRPVESRYVEPARYAEPARHIEAGPTRHVAHQGKVMHARDGHRADTATRAPAHQAHAASRPPARPASAHVSGPSPAGAAHRHGRLLRG